MIRKALLFPLLVTALVVLGCGGKLTVKQKIDRDDRVAFTALHEFQKLETQLYHAKAPWPTAAQHQQVGKLLSDAYTMVIDIATAGRDLKAGDTVPDTVTKESADLTKLVTDVLALSRGTPAATQAAEVQKSVAALTATLATGGK